MLPHAVHQMSFKKLKAERENRGLKSFIRPQSDSPTVEATVSKDVALTPGPRIWSTSDHLPPTLEIRTSPTAGRGVWAKQLFKPGVFNSHLLYSML